MFHGKIRYKWGIFYSYVSLPEGNSKSRGRLHEGVLLTCLCKLRPPFQWTNLQYPWSTKLADDDLWLEIHKNYPALHLVLPFCPTHLGFITPPWLACRAPCRTMSEPRCMSGMAVEVEVEVVQPMILPQRSKVAWADFHMVPNSDCQYDQYMDLMAFNGRDHQP